MKRGDSSSRRDGESKTRPRPGLVTALVCVVIGLMITISSISARGTDLRPGRNSDLVDLIASETQRKDDLTQRAAALRAEVDELSSRGSGGADRSAELEQASLNAGLVPVSGPGMSVTLTDAPSWVQEPGLDQDLLIVHQQDIQAVVNALWGAGAEAMTIQGQRVISTTGIKCVGNTVVLHGTPYAPPYVISAIGDPQRLEEGLTRSEHLRIYRQYVTAYNLGYQQRRDANLAFPGFAGAADLSHAHAR